MLPPGELVKVADVEPLVSIAIERQHALDLDDRRPLRRRRVPAPIEQAVIADVLQPPGQPLDRARTAAENLRRLNPRELPGQGSQDDLLHLHGTLHNRPRIGPGYLLGTHSFHGLRQARSSHGSLSGGPITYLQHAPPSALTLSNASASIRPLNMTTRRLSS